MSTKVITPVATISYPRLVTADEKGKWGCALVFPKGTDLKEMKAAAIAAAKEKFGDKAAEMIRKKQLRMPFRDDAEAKGYPEGSIFINVRSNRKPGVVSRFPDAKGRPSIIPDENIADTVYPGAQVKASLVAFYYDKDGNKGITFGLNNIQKWADGERIDGRVNAQDEFDADESAAANLDDLEGGDANADEEDDDIADLLK